MSTQVTSHPSSMRYGFSLLELSVVLGIIALIAGVGMTMAQGALKAADRITTQERLSTIKIALDSFANTYGYYPCPFGRGLVPSDAAYGRESRTVGSNNCVVATGMTNGGPGLWFGGVPVRTLGLPDHYAGDAWGNKFTYAVTAQLASEPSRATSRAGLVTVVYGTRGSPANFTLTRRNYPYTSVTAGPVFVGAGLPGELTVGDIVQFRSNSTPPVYSGSGIVASIIPTTSFTVTGISDLGNDTGTVEYQDAGDNASYIVISHGADGRGAWPVAGSAVPAKKLCTGVGANTSPPPCTDSGTTTCIDIENCNDSNTIFYDTAFNDSAITAQAAQYFDDYVVWGSNDVMRAPVNTKLYTSETTSNCPTGTCEAWCAACTKNFPGGLGVVPPAAITSNPILCKKVISSNATTCTASCFWSGTIGASYQPCP